MMESTKKNRFLTWGFMRKKEEDMKNRWFLDNGSVMLQELIADCNGKSNPIRGFSSYQILKATKNFDTSCFVSDEVYYSWYKGMIEDRFYLIKRFSEEEVTGHRVVRLYGYSRLFEIYNDIVMSARMSNHNNFLKLLGCCLEFPLPVLVFEYAGNGVLDEQGGIANVDKSSLPWNIRLKIAKEIANAVTYLHMAFPRIIIHRDVKPMHVFLDKNWTAKLSDLSFSISLPEGKLRIQDKVLGTFGYLDPSYYRTRFVSEYTDVFSFGVFLMVLLTGRPATFAGSDGIHMHVHAYLKELQENGEIMESVDKDMLGEITAGQRSQIRALVELALICCKERDEDRPKMIQVAKELKRIERSSMLDMLF